MYTFEVGAYYKLWAGSIFKIESIKDKECQCLFISATESIPLYNSLLIEYLEAGKMHKLSKLEAAILNLKTEQ